eukprot:Awhi_evm1s4100
MNKCKAEKLEKGKAFLCEFEDCERSYSSPHSRRQHYRRHHHGQILPGRKVGCGLQRRRKSKQKPVIEYIEKNSMEQDNAYSSIVECVEAIKLDLKRQTKDDYQIQQQQQQQQQQQLSIQQTSSLQDLYIESDAYNVNNSPYAYLQTQQNSPGPSSCPSPVSIMNNSTLEDSIANGGYEYNSYNVENKNNFDFNSASNDNDNDNKNKLSSPVAKGFELLSKIKVTKSLPFFPSSSSDSPSSSPALLTSAVSSPSVFTSSPSRAEDIDAHFNFNNSCTQETTSSMDIQPMEIIARHKSNLDICNSLSIDSNPYAQVEHDNRLQQLAHAAKTMKNSSLINPTATSSPTPTNPNVSVGLDTSVGVNMSSNDFDSLYLNYLLQNTNAQSSTHNNNTLNSNNNNNNSTTPTLKFDDSHDSYNNNNNQINLKYNYSGGDDLFDSSFSVQGHFTPPIKNNQSFNAVPLIDYNLANNSFNNTTNSTSMFHMNNVSPYASMMTIFA